MDESIQKKEIIIGLDLSTTCTGYCVMTKDRKLLDYGKIKGSEAGLSKLQPLEKKLKKMRNMIDKIMYEVILPWGPDKLVIEEISGSKNRLGQKTLDGFHWLLISSLENTFPGILEKIFFYDVSGSKGWRKHLDIRLSEQDKLQNKEAKKLNKKLDKASQIRIISQKHVAARYSNKEFNLALDVDNNSTDNDVADAVAMTSSYILNILK